MSKITDYTYTIGLDPWHESVRCAIEYRGRVYFYTSALHDHTKEPSRIIKRQCFGKPVNPTIPKDSPTYTEIMRRIRVYCMERGLKSEPTQLIRK